MNNRYALLIVVATTMLVGSPHLMDRARRGGASDVIAAAEFPRGPHTAGPVAARLQDDVEALKEFRPGYDFWRNIYTIPDGSIAFGSGADGRLLAVFPVGGDWARSGKWADGSLADTLDGHTLPSDLDERRKYVARLLGDVVGPVLHNATRGGFVKTGARLYGSFLGDWGTIYERFGVPAEIGLAQALVESGFEGMRRSEADAVGLCQWLDGNWRHLDRLDSAVIEAGNQTTQAAYCGAYVSILATKYGSFIPALSAHHAGGTNVGRILVSGRRLGATEPRERYLRGSDFARNLRAIAHNDYGDIYQSYGPRSYRYAEMVFGNAVNVRRIIDASAHTRIHAMRTTRAIPLDEITKRTGLSAAEIMRFNPALTKRVPAGATLYLPKFDAAFGEDVSFWHRPASAEYATVLDDFVRLDVEPEQWDRRSFEPTLREFERRFRATGTEEGRVMATMLVYVRQESMTSPRGNILTEFQNSVQIRDLFERGEAALTAE